MLRADALAAVPAPMPPVAIASEWTIVVPVALEVAFATQPAPLVFSPAPPAPPVAVESEVTALIPLNVPDAVAAPPAAPAMPSPSLSPPTPPMAVDVPLTVALVVLLVVSSTTMPELA